jgi:hypothetical protein
MLGKEGKTHYTECQALSLVVRIGSPRPLTRKRVLPAPRFEGGTNSLVGANLDEGTDILVLYTSSTGGMIV